MNLKKAFNRNSFNLTHIEFEDYELQSIRAALLNAGNTAIANAISKVMDEAKAKRLAS
jgi:hypothetical protein